MSAIAYTDDMLNNLEASLTGAIETSKARSESLIGALQGFLDIVTANRAELVPEQIEHSKEQGAGRTVHRGVAGNRCKCRSVTVDAVIIIIDKGNREHIRTS